VLLEIERRLPIISQSKC